MAANTSPIFPLTPVIGVAELVTATAVTARTSITGTTGLVALTPVSTNGKRVDQITVKAQGTTVASILFLWLYNGTKAFLLDEIDITAVTPSNTVDAFSLTRTYQNLIIPPTYQLYISQTVQTNVSVFANGGDY